LAFRRILIDNFGAMIAASPSKARPDLQYAIDRGPSPCEIAFNRHGGPPTHAEDEAVLLHLLEQDLVIQLQRNRPDLFFLHSAAVEWRGRAVLLAAESGAGKSTTTFGLLHQAFAYLSDELSPVDTTTLSVAPYPHALCLKQRPAAFPLPDSTIDLGRTLHVPAAALPTRVTDSPRPLGAVFLLRYSAANARPCATQLSAAEAAARLYVTALNALAHEHHGLEAAAGIARSVPCFSLAAADLQDTCNLIRSLSERRLG
jgi:hypothetical protein